MKARGQQRLAVARGGAGPTPLARHAASPLPVARPSLGRRLHRRLRGRYPLAIVAVLVGLAAGGVLGWLSEQPLYRATGQLYFKPSLPGARSPTDQGLLPLFESFLASQAEVLAMGKTTRQALATEAWQATGGGDDAEAVQAFEARREVARLPGTHIVEVRFVDPDPDVAVAGVRALIEAYQLMADELGEGDEGLLDPGEPKEVVVRRLKEGLDTLQTLTSAFGGLEGLEIRQRAAVRLVVATEEAQRSLRRRVAGGSPGPDVPSPSEIAVESEQLAEQLAWLAIQQAEETVLARRLGPRDPRLVELRNRIRVLEAGVDEFAESWNRARAAVRDGPPTTEDLEAREAGLAARRETLQAKSQELGRIRAEAEQVQTANDELAAKLDRRDALDADLAARLAGKGQLQIVDPGTRPTVPWRDQRRLRAGIAGGLGALLAFLLVLLLGGADRRLQSAGHVDDVLSRVRSLGLLPVLSSDPRDAQGRQSASHFAHQIRTLLEIAHAPEKGACICVSGPAPGSGATTLTAALGLSFASSGTRTLLVDADPTDRGLTRLMARMLQGRVTHVGAGSGPDAARAATPDGLVLVGHDLLAPLVPARGSADWPAPEEVARLLVSTVRRLGLRRARETGVVEDLFALADLLGTGQARDQLAVALMEALDFEGVLTSGSPAEWIPGRIRRLDEPGADLDGPGLALHLHRTGVDTLRFLTLGGTGREGAPSVATMARILTRIRDQFDVVLVDPGPIPGSDASSLAIATADAVVVAVSPQDHRLDAERTLTHLDVIGARVAGVVFNRASEKDILETGRTRYLPPAERRGV